MVDMAMGEQDLLDRDAMLGGGVEPVEVPTGIDKCAEHRLRAPQQGAVLLQRGDRDDGGSKRRVRHAEPTRERAATCRALAARPSLMPRPPRPGAGRE